MVAPLARRQRSERAAAGKHGPIGVSAVSIFNCLLRALSEGLARHGYGPYVFQCTPTEAGQNRREPEPAHEADYESLDHRTLIEIVRGWVEFRLADTSLRDLADEMGIAKSSIDKFVKGESLPNKNWPKLRFWFLKDRRSRRASLQDPAETALLFLELIANIPAAKRREAIERTMEHYEAIHQAAHAPRPEWLDELRDLAERDGIVPPPVPPPPPPRKRGRRRKNPEQQ